MKMLGKLARSLAARYVCQNCEKEKERRAVAHNATKCLERNSLLAESNQAASIEIHRLEKALAKAELERDVAREMLLERSTPDTRPGGAGMRFVCDACQDITNIEADRMEIQGEKLMVYSRGRLVYVADLGQIMMAKLMPGREDGNGLRANSD